MTGPIELPDPPSYDDPCPACGRTSLRVRWHMLPILDHRQAPDCAAPLTAGEHLCVSCGACGYIYATRTLRDGEGP